MLKVCMAYAHCVHGLRTLCAWLMHSVCAAYAHFSIKLTKNCRKVKYYIIIHSIYTILELCSKIGGISEIQRKTVFSLVFRSICTSLELCSKIGGISEIQRKTNFSLVFRSICTIFVGERLKFEMSKCQDHETTTMTQK